jgi:hypothetical protein
MKQFFHLLLLIVLLGCSSEEKELGDVFEIRKLGELATTEYTIGKIIELNDEGEWYKFGDRSILISCKASVKAGIDFQKMSKNDIVVNGNDVHVTLPYPELLSFDMDPRKIKTEMTNISGFRAHFTQEEKNKILTKGEKAIREQLKETSIIQTAKMNAETFVVEFYKELGYRNVEIEFKKPYQEEFNAL